MNIIRIENQIQRYPTKITRVLYNRVGGVEWTIRYPSEEIHKTAWLLYMLCKHVRGYGVRPIPKDIILSIIFSTIPNVEYLPNYIYEPARFVYEYTWGKYRWLLRYITRDVGIVNIKILSDTKPLMVTEHGYRGTQVLYEPVQYNASHGYLGILADPDNVISVHVSRNTHERIKIPHRGEYILERTCVLFTPVFIDIVEERIKFFIKFKEPPRTLKFIALNFEYDLHTPGSHSPLL